MDDQRLIRLLPPYPPHTAKETLRQKMVRQVHARDYVPFSSVCCALTSSQQQIDQSAVTCAGDAAAADVGGSSRGSARVLSPVRKSVSFMPAFASRLFRGKDDAEAVLDEVQQQQQQQQLVDKEVQQAADQDEIEMLCKLLCVYFILNSTPVFAYILIVPTGPCRRKVQGFIRVRARRHHAAARPPLRV